MKHIVLQLGVWLASATAAMAGCNSGNIASGTLLSTSGCQANASGSVATAVGTQAEATGAESAAFGTYAKALGFRATAIGLSAGPGGGAAGSVNLGASSGVNGAGAYSTAIGGSSESYYASIALGNYSIAIGGGDAFNNKGAQTTDAYGVAIGTGSVAFGVRSTAVGSFAGNGSTTGSYNSALGDRAGRFQAGAGNVAVGLLSGNTVIGDSNVAIGNAAGESVTGTSNIAIGIGANQNITASYTVAVGARARASAANSVAIGRDASATKARAVAIGQGSVANVADTVSIGSNSLRRRIVNVAPAVSATDAVNLAQLQAAIAVVAPGGGADGAKQLVDDIRQELSSLRALVQRQHERIAQLEAR